MTAWIAVAAGYLLGSVPFGYLIVRLREGRDIRAAGSGNIGAANVTRAAGLAVGALTLLLDAAKGYFAVWLAARLTEENITWMMAAGLMVATSGSTTGVARASPWRASASRKPRTTPATCWTSARLVRDCVR